MGRLWSPYLASRAIVFEFLWKGYKNMCAFMYMYDWVMKTETGFWRWCYFQLKWGAGSRSQFRAMVWPGIWGMEKCPVFSRCWVVDHTSDSLCCFLSFQRLVEAAEERTWNMNLMLFPLEVSLQLTAFYCLLLKEKH